MTDCYLQFLLGFILACILVWVIFRREPTRENIFKLEKENFLLEQEVELLKQELKELKQELGEEI